MSPIVQITFKVLLFHVCVVSAAVASPAQITADTVYRTVLLRAAPGSLNALLELYVNRRPVYQQAGVEQPVLMRHSQGDQWDLMALFPIGSMSDYFGKNRASSLDQAGRAAGLSEEAFQDSMRSPRPSIQSSGSSSVSQSGRIFSRSMRRSSPHKRASMERPSQW